MNGFLAVVAGGLSLGLSGATLTGDLADCANGKGDRAIHACNRVVGAAGPEDLKTGYYVKLRGVAYFKNHKYDLAIKDLNAVAQRNSLDPRLFMIRGDAYHFTRQYEKAIRDYGVVIRLNGKYVRAYYNRAIAHRKLERYKAAISDFSSIIQLKPKDALAYQNRGHIFLRMNTAEKAIPDFERAVKLAPKSFNVHHSLGEGYFRAGNVDSARDVWLKSCQYASKEQTRNWQTRLTKAGHFSGPVDGVCDGRIIEAFSSCAANKCQF